MAMLTGVVEFLGALNATRSAWHKIIREAIKVYCTGLYARVVDFHRKDGPDPGAEHEPADCDDVIRQSMKLASEMDVKAPVSISEDCFAFFGNGVAA